MTAEPASTAAGLREAWALEMEIERRLEQAHYDEDLWVWGFLFGGDDK